jgi:subtilisin family serine protease
MHAQRAYWVFFTDKNGTSFNPYTYFAPEAIERREKLKISLYDSTDFPVNENYVNAVRQIVDETGYETRWFNGVGVMATDEEVFKLKKLSFVREVVEQIIYNAQPACSKIFPDTIVEDVDGNERNVSHQLDQMQGKYFQDNNKKGKGIVISILDAGFKGADTHPAFDHLRLNNQIRATFDFVHDNADIYSTAADHGTMVLSCIAGIMDQKQMGMAPEATFLLARIAREYGNQYRGEENYVAGVEWSDKQGAMIINCSGGPGERAYFPEQMNGKIPLISRASNMAASKGILVIAAAGNEGETYEPNLLPPSDADSVLSVTATNDDGYIADYSSFGPLPDFRRKPDVCAPGTAIVANGKGDYEVAEGTSFSAPFLVGFAACLLEMYPDLSPVTLADTMRRCASLYPYYDYSHGYGIPQASYFFKQQGVAPQTFTIKNNGFISEDAGESITVEINENFKPTCGSHDNPKFYYSLEDGHGRIYKYEVYGLINGNSITIPQLKEGIKVNVFYQGYYASIQL